MSEPDISTLARRLAEQNNVDWRALHGSGPAGKVVERDVLDYLAKVMAGEEAVNPTAEPVPEGMEAWPEQDMQGFRAGVGEAATLGELRDELGNASRDYLSGSSADAGTDDGFTAPPPAFDPYRDEAGSAASTAGGSAAGFADAPASAAGSDGAIDEDIFLFDDEEPAPATFEPAVVASAYDGEVRHGADDLDDLLVAGDDVGAHETASATTGSDTYATSPGGERFGGVTTGYLSEDALAGDQDGVVTATGHDGTSQYLESFGGGPERSASESSWGSDITFGGAAADDDKGGDVPDLWGPAATAASDDSDLWTGPAGATVGGFTDARQVGPDVLDSDEAAATSAFDDDAFSAGSRAEAFDARTEAGAFGSTAPAEAFGAGTETDTFAAATDSDTFAAGTEVDTFGAAATADERVDELVGEPVTVAASGGDQAAYGVVGDGMVGDTEAGIDAGLAAVGATLLTAGATTLPLARPGTILRRNIDVSALAAAQLAVGQELGFDEPLGASAFLLRAVVKAAASTGFSSGAVGLAVLEEDVAIRRIDGAADMSFADLVAAVAQSGVTEDEPVLVAADLSVIDVDEAVLELDAPVISLGRILYDNQRGAYRSSLSLTGPVPLDTAARLLARVAELLDAPVRLVL